LLFGYQEHELLGQDIDLLIDLTPQGRAANVTGFARVENLEQTTHYELVAKHRSGAPIPIDVTLRVMRLVNGVHLVALVRDVSERRRIDALKDSFVATVSHELRTPLTSIAGSLELLRGGAGGQLPPRALRLVEIAGSNSARLVRLINDILDVEKIRSGAFVFEKKPLCIKDLAQAACDSMSGLAYERNVALGVDPIDPSLWMLGDNDLMMQAMANLLSNAIKVSPPNGEVRIAAEALGERVRVLIIDQGPGVPEDFRERIFTRFAQADSTDGRQHDGTGLGLSIVRELVQRHAGAVGFESEIGAGATFFIDLPLTPAPADAVASRAAAPKILICEDDELIAEVLGDQLEMLGYAFEVVSTANAARHALHTGGFNALLLDIRLPDSDGVTLMRALRGAPTTETLPIIVMSGSAEHRDQAKELDIVDWLDKPIRLYRLQNALVAALSPQRAAPALILHIDDDPDLIEVARSHLGRLGEVISARSIAAARSILDQRRPDLVILDMGLPDGSGERLLEDLRRTPEGGVSTIIYSAQDLLDPPAWPVEAVLTKSRSDLSSLARVAKSVLEGQDEERA